MKTKQPLWQKFWYNGIETKFKEKKVRKLTEEELKEVRKQLFLKK